MMQKETLNPQTEINNKVAEIAEAQRLLGSAWGEVYFKKQPTNAEIALRNPVVYINEGNTSRLPETLKQEWFDLLDYCKVVVDQIDQNKTEWARNTSEIEKIHTLVRDGKVSSTFKGSIADIIIRGSELLAVSVVEVPPKNPDYYKGNTSGMEGWITRHLDNTDSAW